MRYFLFPMALLADRESQSAVACLLVGAHRLRSLLSTGSASAHLAAVAVSAVAATAQEEDLPTAIAADEAEGVHGPMGPLKLDVAPYPCDELLVGHGLVGTT